MKTLKYILYIAIATVLFAACNEKENIEVLEPENITVKSGYGEVIFNWTFPDDKDAEYIRVNYVDNDIEKHKKFSRYTKDAIVKGLSAKEYEFTVFAVAPDGTTSKEAILKATPNDPPYLLVEKTIEVEPTFGGIIVTWKNATKKAIQINVEFIDSKGIAQRKMFISDAEEGKVTVANASNGSQDFKVYTSSVANKLLIGEKKVFTLTPYEESEIDHTELQIVDFSSEEASGEGPPNGLASAAIDGDLKTFWHSQWQGAQPGYPHYFTIDLGKEVILSSVELYRRQGDKRGQTKFKIYTSLDGSTFEDLGEFEFDATIDDGQRYPVPGAPKARYFKYEATEGPNHFAFLAEIKLFGAVAN